MTQIGLLHFFIQFLVIGGFVFSLATRSSPPKGGGLQLGKADFKQKFKPLICTKNHIGELIPSPLQRHSHLHSTANRKRKPNTCG